MLFLTLTLENFGLYQGRHSLNLQPETTAQGHRPIILIGGLNGGGKTTLMDAIRLALYGSRAPIPRRKKSLPYAEFLSQCISRQAAPDSRTSVELSFQQVLRLSNIDQLAQIRVQSILEPQPERNPASLPRRLARPQPHPNLGRTHRRLAAARTLQPVSVFDGEQIKELAEQDSPTPSVIAAIRTVLGLSLIDRLSRDLDSLTEQKHREQAQTAASQQLAAIEQRLSQQRQDLEQEAAQQERLQAQIASAEAAAEAAERQQFEAEGGRIREAAPEIERQLQIYRSEADHQRQNLRHLAADLLYLALISPLLQSAQQQVQAEQQRQQAEAAQALIQTQNQQLLALITQLQLSRPKARQIEALLSTQQTQLTQLSRSSPPGLKPTPTPAAPSAICPSSSAICCSSAKAKSPACKPSKPTSKPSAASSPPPPPPQTTSGSAPSSAQAARAEAELNASLEASRRISLSLTQQIAASKAELQAYGEAHGKLQSTQDLLQSAAQVQQSPSPASVTSSPAASSTPSKPASPNTSGCCCTNPASSSASQLDPSQFSLTLYGSSGQALPKHSLSAGEKQLLAIAFLWALSSVSGRQLPVAIDTPLSRLDSSHRQNLIQHYFPTASHQMILLSTDTEIGQPEAASPARARRHRP